MADKELDRRLDELFDELTSPPAPAADDPPLQLDGLFSAESSLPPTLAVPPVKAARQNIEPPQLAPRAGEPRPTEPDLIDQLSRWGIDPLLETLAGDKRELAAAALFHLLQQSEAANRHVLALAKSGGRAALLRGGEIYISHLLGQKFVFVPPGPFKMGSSPADDELSSAAEQPRHTVNLPGFWMARYLLTTAHFQSFLAQSGYRPAGQLERDNTPVTNVTWFDALACCRWLADRSGLPVTLPSEAEWEKAARGADGRRYPWGNQPPTPQLCNFSQITPVGQYSPQGDSPFGCADMGGNVGEWTRSQFRPYPYRPHAGREDEQGQQPRVIRGLPFNNPRSMTRCAYRHRLEPQIHLPTLGFRLVVSAQ